MMKYRELHSVVKHLNDNPLQVFQFTGDAYFNNLITYSRMYHQI